MAKISLPKALLLAHQHLHHGRLAEAEAIATAILATAPGQSEAHHLLGEIACMAGNYPAAIAALRRAIELDPDRFAAHYDLGLAYQSQGNLDAAVVCYRWALDIRPDYAPALANLGVALKEQGQLDEALTCCRRAVELYPDFPEAQQSLGSVLQALGRLDEAAACYRQALVLRPTFAETQNNLGSVLATQGKLLDAIACYRQALQQHPEWAKVHVNLGDALRRLREFEEAAACYRRALELDPARPAVYESLGNALGEQGKLEEAIACFRRALEIQPEFADAHNNLGNALKDQGRLTEAVACFHRALTLEPDHQTAHTNLLLSQHYDATSTLESIAQAHARWNQSLPAPLRAEHSWPDVDRAPNRRLRLGFVSPDLGGHPVGYFLLEVLKSLDRDDAATICYSDRVMGDDMTAELRGMAGLWRDVPWLSDGELAAQIRADRIDVLFDLAGHTGGNRLLVFARKPAPIQITWMGYVGTTGLSEMDYLLADRYEVPEEYAQHYHEAVLWMPDDYVCYAPPPDAPPVGPLPSDDRGSITFASFNNPAKIGPPVVRTWATILRQVPNSRLLLKYLGFGDHGTQQYFHNLFRGEGIDPDRVELLGWSRHRELLQSYHRVDIGLDPFPYCGGLTTCEALWMGVPVVTCPGVTFASRHGLSHLSNVGLTETIACDLEQYAALAVALARDRPRLAALRAGLRPQMAASPLCNGPRFATHLMKLLRGVWQQWIAT